VHQFPYLLSPRPLSIGADGDSAFHFAIQMKLRDPALFPKDIELNEIYLSSRPTFEFAIHRAVIWLADHLFGGNLFVANIAAFWGYHLLFLAGCYFLGLFVLQSRGGAALFTAASVGLSQAFSAWWGMAYGAVIPKYIGLTAVPWFVLGYLRWSQRPWRLVALFFALGLFVNVYPTLPLYLAVILLAVTLFRPRPPWVLCFCAGGAFLIAALPSVLASALAAFDRWRTLDAHDQAILETLLMRHYSYALLNLKHTAASLLSPLWLVLLAASVGLLLKHQYMGKVATSGSATAEEHKSPSTEHGVTDRNETERQFLTRLSVWIVVLALLGIIARLVNGVYAALAHTALVGISAAGFALQAARMRLLARFRISLSAAGRTLLLFTIWTLALSLAGFFVGAVYRPLLTFLFHRASAFLYIPAYLGCACLATHWLRHRTRMGFVLGAGISLLMLFNGLSNTALSYDIRNEQVPQTSDDYYALADWAAQNTPCDSLFMVPYGVVAGTYYVFRVYAERGVLLHWATGEIAISNPELVQRFWQIASDVAPLYEQTSDTAEFLRVAHTYRVDYIITNRATPRPPDLPVAYQNGTYTVFIVPPG